MTHPIILHCCGNVFTELLTSNIGGEGHALMGGIYEVQHWDMLSCHGIHTKFHKDWFRHSKVDREHTHTVKESKVTSLAYFYFFKIWKVAPKKKREHRFESNPETVLQCLNITVTAVTTNMLPSLLTKFHNIFVCFLLARCWVTRNWMGEKLPLYIR
jgi:hypothetical protein